MKPEHAIKMLDDNAKAKHGLRGYKCKAAVQYKISPSYFSQVLSGAKPLTPAMLDDLGLVRSDGGLTSYRRL